MLKKINDDDVIAKEVQCWMKWHSWISYPSRHARSRFTCIYETMASEARVCLDFDPCGRKGRWPWLLLSCCFRVTLFRSKIRNKIFLTFALHHAVKTIQGRGCSIARSTHAGVISGADELLQWEALNPHPTPPHRPWGVQDPRSVNYFVQKKKDTCQIHVKKMVQ